MPLSVDQALRKAKRHANRGEAALAARLYERVLEKYPENQRAIEGLQRLRRPGSVESRMTAPRPSDRTQELIALYGQGKLEDALTLGEALTRQSPNSPLIQNLLGVVNARLGRFEQAVASFTEAVKIAPDNADALNNLGNALNRLGRHADAVARCEQALTVRPDFAEAHNNLGNALLDLGELERAASSFARAVQINSEYAEAHFNLGSVLRILGKPQEAASSFTTALQIRPSYAAAHRNLGNAHHDLGEFAAAVTSYRNALEINADYAEAHFNLGNALRNLGKLEEAAASYASALKINADHAQAHNNLGNVLRELRKPEAAVSSYRSALAIDPGLAETHNNLGNVLRELRHPEEAVQSCTAALEIRPDYAEAHNNLGMALDDLSQHEEAVASYDKALEIDPGFAEAHNNLGNALRGLGKPDAAVNSYRRALEIEPDFAEAHNNLGIALNNLGEFEEAISSYNRAVAIKADYIEAHRNLSTARQYHDVDSQVQQMLQLDKRSDLSDEDRMHLNFALGKAFGDIGKHELAFSYLSEGNRLRKAQLDYDTSLSRESFARIVSVFSGEAPVLSRFTESGRTTGRRPIFVVGMPRSGTTLVEQILASHSQVYGAGELSLIDKALRAATWGPTQLTSDDLQAIRDSYFSDLQKIGISEPYFTDKNPLNFRWLGFILAAIPEARVVHVKRDARATCWSNFKHYFSGRAIAFAYDMRDIAEYYRMYVGLMEFWGEKFPGQTYDLVYETLTEHQEAETRKLLEYVGLVWEEQCLEFYKTKRAVQTASDRQVRQEMYQGSSDDWRLYAKNLKQMVELLDGV